MSLPSQLCRTVVGKKNSHSSGVCTRSQRNKVGQWWARLTFRLSSGSPRHNWPRSHASDNFGQGRSRRGWALQLLNDDPFHDTQPSWERSSRRVSQMRFHSRQEVTDGRSNSRRWGPIPLVPQRRADATLVVSVKRSSMRFIGT